MCCTHIIIFELVWHSLCFLQRKSEDHYPDSPGDTFSSGSFQIRTISLKCHVDYEVRVFEVAQVRRKVILCNVGDNCKSGYTCR